MPDRLNSLDLEPTLSVEELFERHLDLTPLRGRRRGVVLAPRQCHADRRPSFSVDLDKRVWFCFSCGRGGGLKAFEELVGEIPSRPWHGPRESELSRARREVLRRERFAEAHRREAAPLWMISDHVRKCGRIAAEARGVATRLGEDDPRTWRLLERTARVATEGLAVEAELDALFTSGRLA